MTNFLIILSIVAAGMALFVEIRCTEISARVVWLGSISLFYLINLGFYLLAAGSLEDLAIPKRILICILVGMGSAIFSMITATVIIGLTVKKKEDEEKSGEGSPDEKNKENEKEKS